MAVLAGLSSTPVLRLARTWRLVQSTHAHERFRALQTAMSSARGWAAYRDLLLGGDGRLPCVPYLGLYLRDLIYVNDGAPDVVAGPGAVAGAVDGVDGGGGASVLASVLGEPEPSTYSGTHVVLSKLLSIGDLLIQLRAFQLAAAAPGGAYGAERLGPCPPAVAVMLGSPGRAGDSLTPPDDDAAYELSLRLEPRA